MFWFSHLAQPAAPGAKAQDALWRGRFQVHQADGVAHWNLADSGDVQPYT